MLDDLEFEERVVNVYSREEFLKQENISEDYLNKRFGYIQQKYQKNGYILEKIKENKEWKYIVKTEKTLTLGKYTYLDENLFAEYQGYAFALLFILGSCRKFVYKGSIYDLFDLMGIDKTKKNKESFKLILDTLAEQKVIYYMTDPTAPDIHVIVLTSSAETCLKMNSELFDIVFQVTEKKDFVDCLKVLVAIILLHGEKKNQEAPIMNKEIIQKTGMSAYKVRKALKLLSNNNGPVYLGRVHWEISEDEDNGSIYFRNKGRDCDINVFKTQMPEGAIAEVGHKQKMIEKKERKIVILGQK